jgi:succinate dehydrogenase flavin-adding protein (antitoxin of CptAB toxin-antitoxin module)
VTIFANVKSKHRPLSYEEVKDPKVIWDAKRKIREHEVLALTFFEYQGDKLSYRYHTDQANKLKTNILHKYGIII